MDKQIKIMMSDLADIVLENSGVHRKYSDEDLFNATIILMEVFTAKMYDKHKKKLTLPGLTKLSEEAGKSLNQTILLFTGVDLKKVFKN